MKTINQDDAKLFRKARFRVGLSLCGAFVLLCLYFVALYYILNLPMFGKPPSLDFYFMISMIVEIVAWMLILMALGGGNPKNRYFLYGGIVMELLFSVYIFYIGYASNSGQFAYFAWGLLSLLKVYCLYCYGAWLKSSFWARIYFDKIVEIYTPQPKGPQQTAAPSNGGSRTAGMAQTQPQRQNPGMRSPNFQSYPQQAAAPAPQQINVSHLSRRKQRKLAALMQEEAEARARAQQAALAQQQAMAMAAEAARQEAMRKAAIQEQQERKAREAALQKQLEEERRQAELEAKRAEEARIAEEKKYAAFSGPTTRELMNSIKVKVVNYPLLAVRLGVIVYGELIIFPILTELFGNFFLSTDGQYSFATTGIFTLCIISAAIWTVAIFFLYLRQPGSRNVVLICIAAEIIVNIAYYYLTLKGYMSRTDVEYSPHVYMLFALTDLIRYPLIIWAVYPVFTLPVPRAKKLLPDLYNEENYEDLFEGESEDEEAMSLKDALKSSVSTIKDKTAAAVDTAYQAASQVAGNAADTIRNIPDTVEMEDGYIELDPSEPSAADSASMTPQESDIEEAIPQQAVRNPEPKNQNPALEE